MQPIRQSLALSLSLCVLLLAGCSAPSVDDTASSDAIDFDALGIADDGFSSEIERLLEDAENSPPLIRAEYTLQASEQLWQEYQQKQNQIRAISNLFTEDDSKQRPESATTTPESDKPGLEPYYLEPYDAETAPQGTLSPDASTADTTPTVKPSPAEAMASIRTLQAESGRILEQLNYRLGLINTVMLPSARQQSYWLLQAQLANAQGQHQQSERIMANITEPDLLPNTAKQQYYALQGENAAQLGHSDMILEALIQQSELAAPADRAQIHDQIWAQLQTIDPELIRAQLVSNNQNSYLKTGWYELAITDIDNRTDILQRSQAVRNWQQIWSLHPAALQMPTELNSLLTAQTLTVNHIAVLIPQSGPLAQPAQAVTEGLLAALYQDRSMRRNTPKISFYDSQKIEDLSLFYFNAQYQDIDLVIGPLEKDKVTQLSQLDALPIPTLALNYSEQDSLTLNLYQFGLRIEDEARQAAQQAYADGYRRALSLTPATTWGDRAHQAFVEHWIELGGQILAQQQFEGNNDYSSTISRLLSVDESEARFKELRRFTSQPMEYASRRRQDADVIFLTALPEDGRQIKPTLAFHYAADLPVYATSHIYSGSAASTADQDLNNIRFTSIPWTLGSSPLKTSLSNYRDNTNDRFGNLYALGADAYRIAPYLTQLQSSPHNYLTGETGRLGVTPLGYITRNLDWAYFRNGTVRELNQAQ